MKNPGAELSPQEVVVSFPEGKPTVKRLIRQYEDFLEGIRIAEQKTREILSDRGVSMYDLDFTTKLVMTMYGTEVDKAQVCLARLRKLLYLYEPHKHEVAGTITDADIERAREYPIKNLLQVRMGKAKCIYHQEKTASMHVYKDHAYCFGCNRRADAIDIYMHLHSVGFITAVKMLT